MNRQETLDLMLLMLLFETTKFERYRKNYQNDMLKSKRTERVFCAHGQVNSMRFITARAMESINPVWCCKCMDYNHGSENCKLRLQICARCSDKHLIDLYIVRQDVVEFCNWKGDR